MPDREKEIAARKKAAEEMDRAAELTRQYYREHGQPKETSTETLRRIRSDGRI